LTHVDLTVVFAPLVRAAMASGRPAEALAWLARADIVAAETGQESARRTFATWRAEIDARSGEPEAALSTYEALLAERPADAALALDAAETLIDNGYAAHAERLLLRARDAARRSGDEATAQRAESLSGEIAP
jgi:predicted Zn-dependent protease